MFGEVFAKVLFVEVGPGGGERERGREGGADRETEIGRREDREGGGKIRDGAVNPLQWYRCFGRRRTIHSCRILLPYEKYDNSSSDLPGVPPFFPLSYQNITWYIRDLYVFVYSFLPVTFNIFDLIFVSYIYY